MASPSLLLQREDRLYVRVPLKLLSTADGLEQLCFGFAVVVANEAGIQRIEVRVIRGEERGARAEDRTGLRTCDCRSGEYGRGGEGARPDCGPRGWGEHGWRGDVGDGATSCEKRLKGTCAVAIRPLEVRDRHAMGRVMLEIACKRMQQCGCPMPTGRE